MHPDKDTTHSPVLESVWSKNLRILSILLLMTSKYLISSPTDALRALFGEAEDLRFTEKALRFLCDRAKNTAVKINTIASKTVN